jgi:pimeloyl-ACP methyl ester carboxylesterase
VISAELRVTADASDPGGGGRVTAPWFGKPRSSRASVRRSTPSTTAPEPNTNRYPSPMPLRRHFGPHDRAMLLADGRQLGYAEYGDPEGTPVISCHGGLSSRLDIAPAHDTAAKHHIRIIAPDRPGIGLSDRRAGRTLLDWPPDVAELADHLALERFGVLGWSLGGEFAAVTAYALPDRVTHLGLVASTIPREWPDMEPETSPVDHFFLRFSRRATVIDRVGFRLMGEAAGRRPRSFGRRAGAPDHAAEAVSRAIAEGLHNGHGVLDDYRIYDTPWNFDPAAITAATHLWQGDHDDLVPVSWSKELADHIPGAELTIVPGATHCLWYDHWDEILTTMTKP